MFDTLFLLTVSLLFGVPAVLSWRAVVKRGDIIITGHPFLSAILTACFTLFAAVLFAVVLKSVFPQLK